MTCSPGWSMPTTRPNDFTIPMLPASTLTSGLLSNAASVVARIKDEMPAAAYFQLNAKVFARTVLFQIVNIEVTLGYHIDPNFADYALVQLNNDAEARVILPANLEAIKAQTALYDVQNLVKQRELVRSGIEGDVRKRLATQHIVLEDMSITSFSFSQAYEAAIESKQVAEQNAEKSKNLLTQAQIEAQTAAARAKGEADAAIQTATGKAQSIVLEATAKAKAQQLQRESLTPDLLELRKIEMYNSKWDGALPQYIMGNGGSGLLMQMPTPSTKSAKKSADREDSGNN